jgi:hypothetical protein
VLAAEDVEIEVIAYLEILATSQINRRDRVNDVGRLIELVFLDFPSFIAMDEPFLGISIEPSLGIDHLSVLSLTESKPGRRESLRLDR